MVAEVRPQYPSQWAAITAVAGKLGGRHTDVGCQVDGAFSRLVLL